MALTADQFKERMSDLNVSDYGYRNFAEHYASLTGRPPHEEAQMKPAYDAYIVDTRGMKLRAVSFLTDKVFQDFPDLSQATKDLTFSTPKNSNNFNFDIG